MLPGNTFLCPPALMLHLFLCQCLPAAGRLCICSFASFSLALHSGSNQQWPKPSQWFTMSESLPNCDSIPILMAGFQETVMPANLRSVQALPEAPLVESSDDSRPSQLTIPASLFESLDASKISDVA